MSDEPAGTPHSEGKQQQQPDAASSGAFRLLVRVLVVVIFLGGAFHVYNTLTVDPLIDDRETIPTVSLTALEPGGAIGPVGWETALDDLRPAQALPAWLSALSAIGLGLLVPLLAMVVLCVSWLRNRRAASKAARASRRAREPLSTDQADDQVVLGKVAAIEGGGGDEAMRVVIEQSGVEDQHGNVDWSETGRSQKARPFTLTLASGQQLRVEPDERARLIDWLDEAEVTGPGERERRARLTLGEEVYVLGQLARGIDPTAGYRGSSDQLVLRPPRSGSMLLSTVSLQTTFERRARSARRWFVVAVAYLLLCWSLHVPYWIASLYGEAVPAVITAKEKKRIYHAKSGFRWGWLINVQVPGANQAFREELSRADYQRVQRGSRIPAVHHPRWLRYAQVGKAPTEAFVDLLLSGGLLAVLVVAYLFARMGGRRWHEARRVNETTAGGLPPVPDEGDVAQGSG